MGCLISFSKKRRRLSDVIIVSKPAFSENSEGLEQARRDAHCPERNTMAAQRLSNGGLLEQALLSAPPGPSAGRAWPRRGCHASQLQLHQARPRNATECSRDRAFESRWGVIAAIKNNGRRWHFTWIETLLRRQRLARIHHANATQKHAVHEP